MSSSWATAAELATAGGTLVLAIATFASIRASNRSARLAEESLLASVRPLLMPSRLDDSPLKVGFGDSHWVKVIGGSGIIELTDEVAYLAMSLRNAGAGMAVLHGWRLQPDTGNGVPMERPDLDDFRRTNRDIYIPAGDVYFWQGAIRDPSDSGMQLLRDNIRDEKRTVIDVLYGDQQGGQRAIARFSLQTRDGSDKDAFILALARVWNVDRPDPR